MRILLRITIGIAQVLTGRIQEKHIIGIINQYKKIMETFEIMEHS